MSLIKYLFFGIHHTSVIRGTKTIYEANRKEFRQMVINHSSDIYFDEFKNIFKKHTSNNYFILVIDSSLPSESLRFCKNLLE